MEKQNQRHGKNLETENETKQKYTYTSQSND